MPGVIVDAELRLPAAHLMMIIVRFLAKTYMQQERFGACADDIVLCCAVFIGQAEGRLMNASKLASFSGVARPTTIRKLRELHTKGVLERTGQGLYQIPLDLVNGHEAVTTARRIRDVMASTVKKVSKMNTSSCRTGTGKVTNKPK